MHSELENIAWPGWKTVRLIGRGSFGSVYEITRDVFGQTERAALKVISIPQTDSEIDDLLSDGYNADSIAKTYENHLRSIVNEYSLMRKLNGSANVVHCDDVHYEPKANGIGWDIYIKMELLTPMAKVLPEDIPESTVIKVGMDICNALKLCAKHGIIHRDIKPQNLFISDNGDVKLGDFGIAKTVESTTRGTIVGTFKYMAPEVYQNQPYGAAADIYSLGLVLYWMLNQRRMPFMPLPPAEPSANMDGEAANRRLSGAQIPPPKNGSPELKRIVLKACAHNPAQRYKTAAEFYYDLSRLTLPKSVPIVSDTPKTEVVRRAPVSPSPEPTAAPSSTYHTQRRTSASHYQPLYASDDPPSGRFGKILLGILGSIALVLGIIFLISQLRSCQNQSPATDSYISATQPAVTMNPHFTISPTAPTKPIQEVTQPEENTTINDPSEPPETEPPETEPPETEPPETEPPETDPPEETIPEKHVPIIEPFRYHYGTRNTLYADIDGDGMDDLIEAEDSTSDEHIVRMYTSSHGDTIFATQDAFGAAGDLIGADMGDGNVTLVLTMYGSMTSTCLRAVLYKEIEDNFWEMNVNLEGTVFTGHINDPDDTITVYTALGDTIIWENNGKDLYPNRIGSDKSLYSHLHNVEFIYNSSTGNYDLVTTSFIYYYHHREPLAFGYTRYELRDGQLVITEQWLGEPIIE